MDSSHTPKVKVYKSCSHVQPAQRLFGLASGMEVTNSSLKKTRNVNLIFCYGYNDIYGNGLLACY